MVDDRFATEPPVDQLPDLAWFGIFCMRDPGTGFWDPAEGPQLDEVEGNLIRLCEVHGNGWAAYLQRLDTRGVREYYVYFGDGASLEKVIPELKALHPEYKIEYDRIDDLNWAQYRMWLRRLDAGDNT